MSSSDWPRITPSCAANFSTAGDRLSIAASAARRKHSQAPSGRTSPNSNEAACKEERAGGAPSFASRMAPPTLSPPTTATMNSYAHYRKFHRGERCRQRRPNAYQCLSRSARRPTDLLQMRAIKLASSRGVQHVGDLEDDFRLHRHPDATQRLLLRPGIEVSALSRCGHVPMTSSIPQPATDATAAAASPAAAATAATAAALTTARIV